MNTTQTFYEWSTQSFSASAQVVGETVERLATVNGGVCPPGALVDEARPVESPLHTLFQWDDSQAADAFRKQQARKVINSIRVTQRTGDDEHPAPSYPAFVSVVKIDDSGVNRGYKSILQVVDEPDELAQVMAEAMASLKAFRRRYAALKEFAPVFRAIDQLEIEV
jgi:hypothetical protein